MAGQANSAAAARRGWLERVHWGMEVNSASVSGFLRFWLLAKLRRWRPRSYRFQEEQAAIEAWLALDRGGRATVRRPGARGGGMRAADQGLWRYLQARRGQLPPDRGAGDPSGTGRTDLVAAGPPTRSPVRASRRLSTPRAKRWRAASPSSVSRARSAWRPNRPPTVMPAGRTGRSATQWTPVHQAGNNTSA